MRASTTLVKTVALVLTAPELTTQPLAELVRALPDLREIPAKLILMTVQQIPVRTISLVLMVRTIMRVIVPPVRYGRVRTAILTIFVLKLLLVMGTELAQMLLAPATSTPILPEMRSYGLVLSVPTKITVHIARVQLNPPVSALRPARPVTVT